MLRKREIITCLVLVLLSGYLTFCVVYGQYGYKIQIAGTVLAVGLTAAICVFFMLRKRDAVSVETLMILTVTPLILYSIMAFPMGQLPDEPNHIRRVYLISTGQLFPDAGNAFLIPKGFLDGIGQSSITTLFGEQFTKISSELVECEGDVGTGVYPVTSYFVQALAMKLMMVITDNRIIVMYGTRVLTALFVIFGAYTSMKMVPQPFKLLAFLILLIPETIKSISSISADGVALLYVMLLASFVIRYQSLSIVFSFRHYVILFLLTLFAAGSKFLYFPMIFSVFAIPDERWETKKKKYTVLSCILLLDVLLIAAWVIYCYRAYASGEDSQLGYVFPQLLLIVKRPLFYLLAILNTFLGELRYYFPILFGENQALMGMATIPFIGFLCVLKACSVLIDREERYWLNKTTRTFFILGSIASVLVFLTALYAQWTSYGNQGIQGVQVRYFIPVFFPFISAWITADLISDRNAGTFYRSLMILSLADVFIFTNNFSRNLF